MSDWLSGIKKDLLYVEGRIVLLKLTIVTSMIRFLNFDDSYIRYHLSTCIGARSFYNNVFDNFWYCQIGAIAQILY